MTSIGTGWMLRVLDGGTEPAREVELKPGLEIGRHPQNNLQLQDEHVGRFQLRVVEENGALCFEECGSSNASRVEGRALAKGERMRVAPRQRITFGRSTIEVVAPIAELGTQGPDDLNRTQARPNLDATQGPTVGRAHVPTDERTIAPAGNRTVAAAANVSPAPIDNRTVAPQPPVAPVAKPVMPPPVAAPASPSTKDVLPPSNRSVPLPLPAHKPSAADDLSVGVGGGTMRLGAGAEAGSATDKAFLTTRRARLVLAGEVDRRSVPIDATEFHIGRDTGECRLAHPAVSSRHARLRANPGIGTFQVEDLGSGNHTFLNGAALLPRSPQPLATESHLRFGVIDALFVVDLDGESQRVAPAVYERAVQILVAQGTVSSTQAGEARKLALANGQHPGEALVLANAVKVAVWRSAFESARLTQVGSASRGGANRSWLWIGLGAAALAALVWFLARR